MYEGQSPAYGGTPPDTSPRPFGEIPGLWAKIFQMTEEFFAQETPRASGSNTLISVLIAAVVSAIFATISSLINVGIQMVGVPAYYRSAFGAEMIGVLLGSLCGGLLMAVVSFYLANGLTYLGARVLGGTGGYGSQTYLQSLFVVPIGIVTSLLSLIYVIPIAGPCIGGIAILAVSIFAIVLNVRAVKVVHNLTTGKALAAILWPVLILLVLACLATVVITVLALMGSGIEGIFENIVTNI